MVKSYDKRTVGSPNSCHQQEAAELQGSKGTLNGQGAVVPSSQRVNRTTIVVSVAVFYYKCK